MGLCGLDRTLSGLSRPDSCCQRRRTASAEELPAQKNCQRRRAIDDAERRRTHALGRECPVLCHKFARDFQVVVAETRRVVAPRRLFLTRAHNPGGFSFELSESAPPVQAEEPTPLGELDLDLDDFGPGIDLSAPTPTVAAWGEPTAPSTTPGEQAMNLAAVEPRPLGPSPFSPLAPAATPHPAQIAPDTPSAGANPEPSAGANAEPSGEALERAPGPPSAEDEPVLHFGPGSSAAAAVEAHDARRQAPEAPNTAQTRDVAHDPARPASAPVSSDAGPRIKKIRFPARAATQRRHPGPQNESLDRAPQNPSRKPAPRNEPATHGGPTPAGSPRATRFSSSISQRAPEVDRDSEAGDEPKRQTQAIPEDLPDAGQAAPREARKQRGGATFEAQSLGRWVGETPTAREIWQNARRVWQSTSRHAVTFGGQGLRSAQKFARNVNHRLQVRLEKAAEQRRLEAALHEQSLSMSPVALPVQPTSEGHDVEGHDVDPTSGGSSPRARMSTRSAAASESAAATAARTAPRPAGGRPQLPPRTRRPSPVSLALMGLAKSSLKRTAAPLSALAAAAAVYLAGTHLLGVQGAVSLSKPAALGPKMPNLGSLPQAAQTQGEKKTANSAAPAEPKQAEATPLAMQTEQGPMPEGLSWPGKGLIEVVTSEDELIYIDGVFTGRGPLRRIPVMPGKHHVAIKMRGKERSGTVEVAAEKNTRAVFKSAAAP